MPESHRAGLPIPWKQIATHFRNPKARRTIQPSRDGGRALAAPLMRPRRRRAGCSLPWKSACWTSWRSWQAQRPSSGQCQPSGIGDPHPDNLDRPLASMHGLGRRRRQPVAHQDGQHLGRKAMCQHDRLGDTEWTTGEQPQRPMPLGIHRHGAVPAPLSRAGCSRQFGRASAPMIPHRVHTMRGPNVRTGDLARGRRSGSSGGGTASSTRPVTARRWRACCRVSSLGQPEIVVVCSCRRGYSHQQCHGKFRLAGTIGGRHWTGPR
jgi:hypothetical protein